MIEVRKAQDRGHANHGWLDSYHSFSFAEYYDPQHMGYSVLRVINDDRIAPGAGFPTHGHRDMEIVSYVLEGGLEHKDSLGNGSVLRAGDVQRMSAGTGVRHSEFNASDIEPVHFLQIWILPKSPGLPPSYEQKHFDSAGLDNQLRLVASPDGRANSVTVHQDVLVYAATLDAGAHLGHTLPAGRKAYLHVARGTLHANGVVLSEGDGVKIQDEPEIELSSGRSAEVLLFELPG